MELKDLPTYLLKPLPRSRVKGHVQSMAMFNLRTSAGFQIELAVCENVFAVRRYSVGTNSWSKWVDTKCKDHDAAIIKLKSEQAAYQSRGYFSQVSTGLLLPLNETDVRHLRNDFLLPRAMLEYGSELFAAIAQWHYDESKKRAESAASAAGVPAPAIPPRASTPPPAASSSGTATKPPAAPTDLDDVLGELKARRDKLGPVEEAGF